MKRSSLKIHHREVFDLPALYSAYAGMVRAVIYNIAGERDLDDNVQETFVKVWKGIDKFQGHSSVKTWIYRISVNTALDACKKRQPLTLASVTEFDSQAQEKLEAQDLINKGLQKLTSEHRTVLVLSVLEGLSLREVAEITGVPEGTVKSRLHYAKKEMADFLSESGIVL